jgi:hypothetical protein
MMTETLAFFDYEALDDQTRRIVQQHTGDIKRLAKRAAQDIVEIGQKLTEVKEALGHGRFGEWLLAEFEWTERTAQNFMRVHETFKSEKFSDLRIAPSALYLFASPSTPESAREEGIARARAGETMTYSKAKAIRAVYTQHDIQSFPSPSRFASPLERDTEQWVSGLYQQTMELRDRYMAHRVAEVLNAEQLLKIQEMIAFLQEIERISND